MRNVLWLTLCLVLVSAGIVSALSFVQGSSSINTTYAVPGTNVTATTTVTVRDMTYILNFSLSRPSVDSAVGITTNMTQSGQVCCIFVLDSGSSPDQIQVYNRTGTNTQNITLPAQIEGGVSIWTNVSGTQANDFFILDDGDNFLYHVNRTGGFGNDNTGNFSISEGSAAMRTVIGNETNTRPNGFWLLDSLSGIWLFNRTGTNFANITNISSENGNPVAFWTNSTGNRPRFYLTSRSDEAGALGLYDSNGGYSSALIFNSELSATNVITAIVNNGVIGEYIMANLNDDRVYIYRMDNLTTPSFATNLTGSFVFTTNTSVIGYPYELQVNATVNATFNVPAASCGDTIRLQIRANISDGTTATTTLSSVGAMPYLSASVGLGTIFNTSAQTCASVRNTTVTFSGAGVANLTWRLPYFVRSTFQECNYKVNGSAMVNITNGTECVLTITNFAGNSSIALVIDESTAISGVAPSNVPAALAGASLAIIVVYAVIRRRKTL